MESAKNNRVPRWLPDWLEGLAVVVLGPGLLATVLIYVGVAWWLALIAAVVAGVYFLAGPR